MFKLFRNGKQKPGKNGFYSNGHGLTGTSNGRTVKVNGNGSGRPADVAGGRALIELQGIEKVYETEAGSFLALRGIDLQIQAGEFVSVVGKSGSGKSTLINMLTGIDHPTGGRVRVGETQLDQLDEGQMAIWRGRNMGIVFQFFQLLPTLTIVENVMIPMDLGQVYEPKERQQRAMHLLEQVQMADDAFKFPAAVSGGQQQLAAIARSMANDPPIILADEPTGNLDSRSAEKVFGLFESLAGQGKTIMMVTHDDELANQVPRTITLADGLIVDETLHRPVSKNGNNAWERAMISRRQTAIL